MTPQSRQWREHEFGSIVLDKIELQAGNGGQAADLTSVLRERGNYRAGDAVHLSAAPDAVHLFDRDSGARLG